MPRNGAGSYSLPQPPFVPNTPISSSAVNSDFSDIATAITGSIAADGQTTITGGLKGANGSVGTPAYSFASDLDTGFYRIGSGEIGYSSNGVNVASFNGTGIVSSIAGLDLHGAPQLTAPAVDDEIFAYDLSGTANARITFSDYLKVISQLTADSSPDKTADYLVTYDASATGPKKLLLQNLPSTLARGYIDGCILANGTDATNDINIAAGVCRDSTNAFDIIVSALVKQLDANWAPGTNAGMRNSAAGITNTTYHLFAVAKADGTQDIYADTTADPTTAITDLQAETGGASYVYARRIGSIVRAGGTILGFTQQQNDFNLKSPVMDVDNATPGTSANTATMSSMPTGIVVNALVNVRYQDTGTALYISALTATDVAANLTSSPLGSIAGAQGGQVRVWTNASAQFRYRAGGDNRTQISSVAWTDPRGQNA